MGMDFYKFEIKGVDTTNDIPDIFHSSNLGDLWNNELIAVRYNERFQKWFNQSGFETLKIRKQRSIDWANFEKTYPQFANYAIVDYADTPTQEYNFIQVEDNHTGETTLIGGEDLPIPYLEEKYVFLNFKEVGYMRKPFYGNLDGYHKLKEIDSVEYEDALVFVYNKNEMNALKPFTYDEKLFDGFIEDMKPTHIFHFNW